MVYGGTLGGVVAIDLLSGVLLGLGLALLKLLYTFSHLDISVQREGDRVTLHMSGTATMLRLPKLAAALEEVPASSELHVRLDGLQYIDHACLNLLADWERQHHATGGRLVIDWEELHARFQDSPADRVRIAGDQKAA